jgi:hypothetical protein
MDKIKKDITRMVDTYRHDSDRMEKSACNRVDCRECPLGGDNSLIAELAQENHIITNKVMLEKAFGDDVFDHICSRVFECDWFHEEYKEQKGE